MNNYDEVIQNYQKWYLDLKNKEIFEKQRLKFLTHHQNSGVKRVQIEPTKRCNFNCVMCPIDELPFQKTKTDLSLDDFKLVLSKLPKSVTNICLSGLGEPFLNKDYIEMVKFAKEKGYYVEIYTNGSLFNKEVLKYASEVNFSVDGIDEETLKQIRKGIKVNKLFETIKEAVLNKDKCKININFTANYQNYKEIKKIYDFCDEMGIDNLQIQGTSNNYATGSKMYKSFKEYIKKNNNVDWDYLVKEYTRDYNFALTIWYPRKMKGFCAWGFSNIYITKDLEIITCCQKVTKPIVFGNLKEESFEEIYQKMEWFRKKHIKNEDIFICNECPY